MPPTMYAGHPTRRLQPFRRLPHHERVEARPRHDGERRAVLEPAEVEGSFGTLQRDVQGLVLVLREVEVAGQQVAGALREDPERHAAVRQPLCRGADGPVAARDEHEAGAAVGGVPGLALARVLLSGGDEPGDGQPELGRAPGDTLQQGGPVVDLGRVDHQDSPTRVHSGGRRELGSGLGHGVALSGGSGGEPGSPRSRSSGSTSVVNAAVVTRTVARPMSQPPTTSLG